MSNRKDLELDSLREKFDEMAEEKKVNEDLHIAQINNLTAQSNAKGSVLILLRE